jgi:murein DD-endopeptidase MepM/ murein hydrolase activator NlpD
VWTQTLSFSPRSGRYALSVELGVEPAIELDGERHTFFDHRRVSLRWLCGTVLTGLMGAGLIGAAIYAALDHQSNFAEAPVTAVPVHKDVAETGINPRKGDRLVKPVDIVAAKQTFRVPMPAKIGDKEVMRTRTFTRVETTLLTASAGFADDVPEFNPLKMLANARNPVDAPPEPVQDDAEVAWATRDFSAQNLTSQVALSADEVQAQVAEHVKSTIAAGNRPFSLPSQLLLTRTSRANDLGALAYANPADGVTRSPFSSIEVRMVPENVTNIPRYSPPAGATHMDERLVIMRHGESFENLLMSAGVARGAVPAIVAAFEVKPGQPVVADGRRIKLLFADAEGPGKDMVLARVSVYADEVLEASVALKDDGSYVRLSTPEAAPAQASAPAQGNDDDDDGVGMRLYNALYETGLKQDIPRPIIDDLVRVFANDVDFQRGVTGGDSFVAFYDEGEEGEGNKELLFASITARGETYRYYRFQTPDDGLVDFYDQNGRSTRKFLVRTPILNFKITSGFGVRFHPILGYSRPHTGVDFAAPIGTPIFAAGNGTIVKAGWDSGYGRRIEIQHANGYVTTYNHMSGFARGAVEGARVKQGQTIGYLGQTGLATGPHLHYEVLVNGHFVDPMRVKLARTREFDGKMLAEFMKERDRVEDLMSKAPNASSQVSAKAN